MAVQDCPTVSMASSLSLLLIHWGTSRRACRGPSTRPTSQHGAISTPRTANRTSAMGSRLMSLHITWGFLPGARAAGMTAEPTSQFPAVLTSPRPPPYFLWGVGPAVLGLFLRK